MDFENDIPVVQEEIVDEAVVGGKGLGITALIFSILGFFPCLNFCGLSSVVGFILALVSRAKNGGKLNGPAKAALIITIIVVSITIICAIITLATPHCEHQWVETEKVAATCTEDGYIKSHCDLCDSDNTEHLDKGHTWEKATCEQPAICNGCGETKDDALGHTTDCGVCTHCNKEFRKQSPVTILNWTYTIDYVGGVEWSMNIRNNTDKQIKYVILEWDCYNAVGDLIRDEISWETNYRTRFTGPLDAHATSTRFCNATKFYNHSFKSSKLTEVVVEYMDGTTEKVTNYHDNVIG